MKPVYQTTFGDGSDGQAPGNCLAACVASLLELPLEEVPNFMERSGWRKFLGEWLADRGFSCIWVVPLCAIPPTCGYHLRKGITRLGMRHCVVATGVGPGFVHDPNPQGQGIRNVDEFGFLVPLDPARR